MAIFTQPVFWLAAMIIFLIVEGIVPGLVSIWFAGGALAALIVSFFKVPGWVCIVVFVLASLLLLLLTRPLVKKHVNSKSIPTNLDVIIGKECIVTEQIDNIKGTGAVVAGGKTWTARSYSDDVVIEPETRACVKSIEGVKAVVKPVHKEEKQ